MPPSALPVPPDSPGRPRWARRHCGCRWADAPCCGSRPSVGSVGADNRSRARRGAGHQRQRSACGGSGWRGAMTDKVERSPPMASDVTRCTWAANGDAQYQAYHDTEWGVPHHDDRALFELITLEGAQAGLSWRTVLVRRDAYRAAFHNFDIARCAAMTDAALDALVTDSPLIRHRAKIFSVRDNARVALRLQQEHGSLDRYLWSFVGHQPTVNRRTAHAQVPATTPISDTMSKALRKQGFRFMG